MRAGHDVTYLTRRQWPAGEDPELLDVRVIAVSPGGPLYTSSGRRTIGSPLRFGLGVLWHLLRNRSRYDVVHTCAFPFFSLLAARAALIGRPTLVAVDWFEVWSADYWRAYLGRVGGPIGHAVQRLCVRLTPRAFVFSDLQRRHLTNEGLRGDSVKLEGLYAGPLTPRPDAPPAEGALVVFAGRHIREKNVAVIPRVLSELAKRRGGVRGLILGDGPERPRVLAEIAALGLGDSVDAPGFVGPGDVEDALGRATCLLLPSVREGYGLVVVEAAAAGTPSVVARAPDNAAVELVEDGVNGVVADGPDPAQLVAALERVLAAPDQLRASTREWFEATAPKLTAESSARHVAALYSSGRV